MDPELVHALRMFATYGTVAGLASAAWHAAMNATGDQTTDEFKRKTTDKTVAARRPVVGIPATKPPAFADLRAKFLPKTEEPPEEEEQKAAAQGDSVSVPMWRKLFDPLLYLDPEAGYTPAQLLNPIEHLKRIYRPLKGYNVPENPTMIGAALGMAGAGAGAGLMAGRFFAERTALNRKKKEIAEREAELHDMLREEFMRTRGLMGEDKAAGEGLLNVGAAPLEGSFVDRLGKTVDRLTVPPRIAYGAYAIAAPVVAALATKAYLDSKSDSRKEYKRLKAYLNERAKMTGEPVRIEEDLPEGFPIAGERTSKRPISGTFALPEEPSQKAPIPFDKSDIVARALAGY